MNVKQLRDLLAGQRDDALVVLAKDEEGNSYSPLADVSDNLYRAETTWSGEVLDPGDDVELCLDDSVPAVVLWPVN